MLRYELSNLRIGGGKPRSIDFYFWVSEPSKLMICYNGRSLYFFLALYNFILMMLLHFLVTLDVLVGQDKARSIMLVI